MQAFNAVILFFSGFVFVKICYCFDHRLLFVDNETSDALKRLVKVLVQVYCIFIFCNEITQTS